FKIGEQHFQQSALDQVLDYSLDLKNFHATSHNNLIAPILIASEAEDMPPSIKMTPHNDNLLFPIKTNINLLQIVINEVLEISTEEDINSSKWINGKYSPTPTIIEAALALFNEHSVEDISRNDASAKNLTITSNFVSDLIEKA